MNPLIAALLSGGRASPAVLGSLLVGAVGSQQANQIQKDLALGNISLDDISNFIINNATYNIFNFNYNGNSLWYIPSFPVPCKIFYDGR